MLTNRNILIFGDDWGRHPSTIQHIGRVLSKQNNILWVGSLGLRKPQLRLSDLKRISEKVRSAFFLRRRKNRDFPVHCIYPLVFPFHDNVLIRKFNTLLLRIKLLRAMNKLRIKHPIILSSSPIIAPLIGSLNETSAHYFCLDDNTLFEAAFASIGALEKALIEKADSSFFVSDALLNKLSSKGNRSFYLPQGVEIEHFKPSNGPLPASVALIKKPVVGFFGLLSSWVDYQLIVRCAREYPDASFVIIGKSTVNLSLFSSVPNIVYLGEIEYDVLPQYVNMFDVGLIPFVLNELTLAANPLKFLEYMAMGIPVVSTNLPEVAKFQNNAFVATNDNDFLRLIQRALNDNSPEARHRRRSVASHFSWDIVVDRVSDVIAAIEAEKEMRQENIR